MKLVRVDREMLREAIYCNTDASKDDAAQIIDTVLYKQRERHGPECEQDPYARAVCEGMYVDKCDDVIGLVEALRAVLALAGEDAAIRNIIESAISEHGNPAERAADKGA